MGTKKKRRLPKDVYLQRNRFVYWPYLGCADGKPKRGQQVYLGPSSLSDNEVWEAYSKVTKRETRTVAWMLRHYLQSPEFHKLSSKKSKDNRVMYADKIIEATNEQNKTFGDIPLTSLQPPHIKKYLMSVGGNETRKKHHSLLNVAWDVCINDFTNMPDNQSKKVKIKYEVVPVRDYIDDENYLKVYNSVDRYWQCMMELSYILRARLGELVAIRMDDIFEEGIFFKRTKGSVGEVTLWSDRLRAAFEYLSSQRPHPEAPFLLYDKDGTRPPPEDPRYPNKSEALADKLSDRWKDRLYYRVNTGKLQPEERFTFHDLKAKGISDHKSEHSGHRTITAKKRYLRKIPKVEATR